MPQKSWEAFGDIGSLSYVVPIAGPHFGNSRTTPHNVDDIHPASLQLPSQGILIVWSIGEFPKIRGPDIDPQIVGLLS